jgi:parallel beta-helix repeat protein
MQNLKANLATVCAVFVAAVVGCSGSNPGVNDPKTGQSGKPGSASSPNRRLAGVSAAQSTDGGGTPHKTGKGHKAQWSEDEIEKNTTQAPPLTIDALSQKIAAAKPGAVIEVSAGKYNVDLVGGLKIYNKTRLTLRARGKVELFSRKADSQIVDIKKSKHITIKGFTIYHDVPVACVAACVAIDDSDSVTVKGNDIHGSGAYGVAAWGHHNKNVRVIGNRIHHCSYWGVEIHSKGGEISGNTFSDNGGNIDPGSSTSLTIKNNVKKSPKK